jgi:hypothetical protein
MLTNDIINAALYVTREMLLKKLVKVQWKIVWLKQKFEFMQHTIFQGLGERSSGMCRSTRDHDACGGLQISKRPEDATSSCSSTLSGFGLNL